MTAHSLTIFLPDEAATLHCGSILARMAVPGPVILFLQGQLGAGKTTFSRGFLRELGHTGAVKSPTYTLVEPYDFGAFNVFHFDFYRIKDPVELEFMGIRDYFTPTAVCLIEWPELAENLIPAADLSCSITLLSSGREIKIQAHSSRGESIIQTLKQEGIDAV
jgi:tRNA threonylcarbamoyladenosine biosynthesis protein TsaE